MDQLCCTLPHSLTDQPSRRSCSQLSDMNVTLPRLHTEMGVRLTGIFTPYRTPDAVGAPLLQALAVVTPLPDRASTWLVRAHTAFAARWRLWLGRFL